MSRAKLPKKK
jgi:predicted nucleotidyltransferase